MLFYFALLLVPAAHGAVFRLQVSDLCPSGIPSAGPCISSICPEGLVCEANNVCCPPSSQPTPGQPTVPVTNLPTVPITGECSIGEQNVGPCIQGGLCPATATCVQPANICCLPMNPLLPTGNPPTNLTVPPTPPVTQPPQQATCPSGELPVGLCDVNPCPQGFECTPGTNVCCSITTIAPSINPSTNAPQPPLSPITLPPNTQPPNTVPIVQPTQPIQTVQPNTPAAQSSSCCNLNVQCICPQHPVVQAPSCCPANVQCPCPAAPVAPVQPVAPITPVAPVAPVAPVTPAALTSCCTSVPTPCCPTPPPQQNVQKCTPLTIYLRMPCL